MEWGGAKFDQHIEKGLPRSLVIGGMEALREPWWTLVARALREFERDKPANPGAGDLVRAPALRIPRPPAAEHGTDFTWLCVGKVTYEFKRAQQARVIRVLYEERQRAGGKDGCGLRVDTIAEKIQFEGSRLDVRKLFKGSPALGQILRSSGKGTWALFLRKGTKNPKG